MKVGRKHRYQQNQRPFFVPERVDVVRNLLSPDDSRPFRPLARRDPVEASFMSGNACIRFDVAALRALAGAIVYRRGEVVHRDGRVTIIETEPNRIVASVEGTRNYGTTLAGSGADFGGSCSCPAFADRGFCKHMVAVALAANAREERGEAESVPTLSHIRRYLAQKSVDALVAIIIDQAAKDGTLLRKLQLASSQIGATGENLERQLRRAVDHATDVPHYLDERAASTWAARVGDVLDTVAEIAEGAEAGIAMSLADRVIERLEDSFEDIDDSDGHRLALVMRARDVHLMAARVAKPDPASLARALFARETDSNYEVYSGAAFTYEEVLGEAGLAEYRRLASDAWATVTGQRVTEAGDERYNLATIMHILDLFAARDGDLAARIALRSKALSSAWSYVVLVHFCIDQGKSDDALLFAEEGVFLFEDKPDERLVLLAADLLAGAGRRSDAVDRLWATFHKAPSMPLYRRLRAFEGEAVRDRAIRRLEERAARSEQTRFRSSREILVEILMDEGLFDAAWTAVRTYGATMRQREELARVSEATHASEALTVYAERVEVLVAGGRNSGYAEAATMIARMARLRGVAEQAVYILSLIHI